MYKCIVCRCTGYNNFYSTYLYCNNCFHIQKKKLNNKEVQNKQIQYAQSVYNQVIVNRIRTLNCDSYKILNLGDTNTFILDEIHDVLLTKTSKYNIQTVSLSTLFNPSFFSKHNCHKFTLSEYITDIIKDKYGSFDVIILNDVLNYTDDPQTILKCCDQLSHSNTVIFSINLHTRIFSSLKLFKIDNNVNSIFNTNSMKQLCYAVDMQLDNSLSINEWNLFTIKHGKEVLTTQNIIDTLYDEIVMNTYCTSLYYILSNYWQNTYIE